MQKHTRLQDAGRNVFSFFFFRSGCGRCCNGQPSPLPIFKPLWERRNAPCAARMHSRQTGRAAQMRDSAVAQTPAKHLHVPPRSGAAGAPPTAAAATADKFWGRAEYLQLHFYPQRRRHAALTRTAPAGPVLKAVCNRFLRCTLVL